MHNKVIWNEGMFLQPQHFQQQERHFNDIISQKTTFLDTERWGIKTLELDYDLLRVGKIAIKDASGIFPDGTWFTTPNQDKLPEAVEIKPGTANSIIYLAIPIRNGDLISLDSGKCHERYLTTTEEVKNNIKNINLSSTLLLGKLNMKILLESDDLTQYCTIPIAKINQIRSDNTIILDNEFIPSCLEIDCSPYLAQQVNVIRELLSNRAQMLTGRLTESQQSANAEIIDMLILQIINRYTAIFNQTVNDKRCTPAYLFQCCNLLYAEMSTYTSVKKTANIIPSYSQSNPNLYFSTLLEMVKDSLNIVIQQDAKQISIQRKEFGLWVGKIENNISLNADTLILAVYSQDNTGQLKQNFMNQVKIAPLSEIRELVSRAIPGIGLQALNVAPRQIPYQSHCAYFQLENNHELWQQLKKDQTIAFHISGQFNEAQLELWAIKDKS